MSSQAVLPRRSRRLATIIPASHWISIGYSQDDADLMLKLQNDMKKYSDGSEDNDVELKGKPHGGDGLPHHDMMLPHWQKFFKALNGRTSTNSLCLIGITLPTPVLDMMFPVLQSMNNLTTLNFASAGLGNDGIMKLSSFINNNTSLKYLILGGERINDLSVATPFSDAIKDHSSLDRVALVKCGLSDANIVGKVLEGVTNKISLVMAQLNLGADSINVLANFIRSNHPIRAISITNCNIKDDDTLLFASTLKENTNLQMLNLHSNGITEEGERALLEAVFDSTSMDSIVESNHTCIPLTCDLYRGRSVYFQQPTLEREVFDINANDVIIQQKIRRKVILALCTQDGELFDLSHLNDLPLQLMPRVLELIQEHTDARTRAVKSTPQLEKDALSRLFHTLRGWELPLLFENRRGPSSGGDGKKRKRRKTRR